MGSPAQKHRTANTSQVTVAEATASLTKAFRRSVEPILSSERWWLALAAGVAGAVGDGGCTEVQKLGGRFSKAIGGWK